MSLSIKYYNYYGDYMTNGMFKGFVKAVIILSVAFFIYRYISYRIWLSKGLDNVDISFVDERPNEKPKSEDLSKYKDLYNTINFEVIEENFGEEFFDIYYKGKSFSDEFYIYMGVMSLIKKEMVYNCNLEKNISSLEVNMKINEIFDDAKYEKKSFETKNGFLNIIYDNINDSYLVKINGKCSGYDYSNGGIKTNLISANTQNKELYLYEKAFYLDHSENSNGNLVFNYHSGVDKESLIISNNYESFDLNKVATYKYTFVIKNEKYYLKSINIDY